MKDTARKCAEWLILSIIVSIMPLCARANALEAGGMYVPPNGDFGEAFDEEEYDPLRAELKLDAEELTAAGIYNAEVELSNQGDDVIGDVTLKDAAGNILYGPKDLDLSERLTWRGELNITDAMLDTGMAGCVAEYVLAKGDPLYEKHMRKDVTIAVERTSIRPEVEFSRSQSTTYAQPGQRVTITYTIKNTGNVPITDVRVSDTLFGLVGALSRMEVDEKKTFTRRVTLVSSALSSVPSVSYSYEGSQNICRKDIAASSIKIAKPSLEVLLEADLTLVYPGDTVMLRCKLINNGNIGYKQIQLSDQVLGDLGFIDDLRVGNDTVYAKSVRVQSRTTFKFTITAKDTTGSDVTAVSNSLTIDVMSRSDEAGLTLSAQADRVSVFSGEPVTFTLVICNNGASDIEGIDISERTRGLITHVDTLRAGESMPIKAQYNVTGYEMFTFSATMTQTDGARREALAEPITISLGTATPSPAPSRTPEPTSAATMAPNVLRAYDAAFRRILTCVLAAAVCIAIVLLVVLSANHSRGHGRRANGAGRLRSGAGRFGRRNTEGASPDSDYDDDVKVYVPIRSAQHGPSAEAEAGDARAENRRGEPAHAPDAPEGKPRR